MMITIAYLSSLIICHSNDQTSILICIMNRLLFPTHIMHFVNSLDLSYGLCARPPQLAFDFLGVGVRWGGRSPVPDTVYFH